MKKLYSAFIIVLMSLVMISQEVKAEWYTDSISATYDEDLLPYSSFAIGPDGTYHLVFMRQLPGGFIGMGPREAYYVYKQTGGDWSAPEIISREDTDIGSPSIVVTPDGEVYIAFYEMEEVDMEVFERIIVAKKGSEQWTYEEIPSPELENRDPLLTCDNNGNLHLVWTLVDEEWNYSIAYATNEPGYWDSQQIPNTPNWGMECHKIQVSDDGSVHILFADDMDQIQILSQSSKGIGWTMTALDTGKAINEYTNMIFHQGELHVVVSAFDDWSEPSHLYYFKTTDGIWSDPVQLTTNIHCQPVSLTVDELGKVTVAGLFESSLYLIEYDQELSTENLFAETDGKIILNANVGYDIFDNFYVIYNEEIEYRVSDIYMAHQGVPSFDVTFNVTDQDGNAISDAVITLGEASNEEGDYFFPQVAAGTYTYTVEAEGYQSFTETIMVTEEMQVDIVLELQKFQVTFSVNDQDGNEVTNATITLGEVTNAEGDYVFADVIYGSYTYNVEAPGYHPASETLEITEDLQIDVVLNLVTYQVVFSVSDEDGNAITDAIVTLDGVTNDAGSYTFTDKIPGVYNYTVVRENFYTEEGQADIQEDGQIVEVVLERDYTSVEENHLDLTNVFPNPARDIINITSASVIDRISIMDITGKVVKTSEPVSTNASLSLEDIDTGFYLVKVSTSQGIYTQKIQIIK